MGDVSIKDPVDVKVELLNVLSTMKEFREDVREIVTSNYTDFLPNNYDSVVLLKKGKTLEEDVREKFPSLVQLAMESVKGGQAELDSYREEMDESIRGFKTALKLLSIHSLFEMLQKRGENYEKPIHILDKIKERLEDTHDPLLPKLACYQSLMRQYNEEYQTLQYTLNKKLESLVPLQVKAFHNSKTVTVKIKKDEEEMLHIVGALLKTRQSIQKLCTFLMENVFTPIIMQPTSLECDENDENFVSIQLAYASTVTDDSRPGYESVLKSLKDVFYILAHMNVVLSEDRCAFNVMAQYMKKDICRLLVDGCLQHDIPGTVEEMKESRMVAEVQSFSEFLRQIMFVDGENDAVLEDYGNQIVNISQRKYCTAVLKTVNQILLKDIHDMVPIEEQDALFVQASKTLFSSCMVSKGVFELKKLLDKILTEAEGHGETSDKLIETIAAVLEHFIVDVPQNHEKVLHKIPQQAALFRNDCAYLVYWIQKNAGKLNEKHCFTLISETIKDGGDKIFQHQIESQRTQTLQTLKGFELSDQIVELGAEPQKAIRQCLRQFQLLKNVWQSVLPESVYRSSVADLADTFVMEMIKRIFALEDITTAIGNGLVALIDMIKDNLPRLFKDATDVHTLVKHWTKLLQLQQILNASLVEITDLWAEGKGPLTMCYKSDEVKHLVRALFQNTKQRQMCLSSII